MPKGQEGLGTPWYAVTDHLKSALGCSLSPRRGFTRVSRPWLGRQATDRFLWKHAGPQWNDLWPHCLGLQLFLVWIWTQHRKR